MAIVCAPSLGRPKDSAFWSFDGSDVFFLGGGFNLFVFCQAVKDVIYVHVVIGT